MDKLKIGIIGEKFGAYFGKSIYKDPAPVDSVISNMNGKILAGLFVILGMAGMSFAFFGNGEHVASADFDRGAMKENREVCHAYFTSEEHSELRAEMKDAIEAGDREKVMELKEEIMENAPEGCKPRKMIRRARIMHSLPEDVREEFKTAMENKDIEALKALKEEYFPKPPFEKPEMMN